MGYVTVSARGYVNPEFVNAFPILHGKTHAMRQWSVRRLEDKACVKAEQADQQDSLPCTCTDPFAQWEDGQLEEEFGWSSYVFA
jgi:hypothetical protein